MFSVIQHSDMIVDTNMLVIGVITGIYHYHHVVITSVYHDGD